MTKKKIESLADKLIGTKDNSMLSFEDEMALNKHVQKCFGCGYWYDTIQMIDECCESRQETNKE